MSDPFDTLGLEPRFDLDASAIRRAYLARSAALHPDTRVGAEDREDGSASALLNAAKRIIDDPERRANALLARLGGPGSDQDKSLPPGFLAETMEMREAVEEAIGSGDAEARARVERDAAAQREGYIERVGELFRAAGTAPTPESLRAIRIELNAWRYIERLIEQLDPAYDPGVADFRP